MMKNYTDERNRKKEKDDLMKIVYGHALPSLSRLEEMLKLRPIQFQTEKEDFSRNKKGKASDEMTDLTEVNFI